MVDQANSPTRTKWMCGLLHEGEVGVPAGFGPLLGIPGGAEFEWDFVGSGGRGCCAETVKAESSAGGARSASASFFIESPEISYDFVDWP